MKKLHLLQLGGITAKVEINSLRELIPEEELKQKPILYCWKDFKPVYNIEFLQSNYHHSSFGISCSDFDKLTQFIAGLDFSLSQKEYEDFYSLPF